MRITSVLGALGLAALVFTSPIAAQDVYRVSDQVTAPQAVVPPRPQYNAAVMMSRTAGVSGAVELELDVLPDGTVGTVALVKSLHPELDKNAVDAAKRATFTPGTKDGTPVTVRIVVTIEFNRR